MRLIRTDKLRAGDLIVGTELSGDYADGPRRVQSTVRAPEHEQRKDGTFAYWVVWTKGGRQVYYADTYVWLAQRP